MQPFAQNLPLRALLCLERWDCRGCGKCCRGTIITLSEEDLQRFRSQQWDKHSDYRGVKLLVRMGLFSGRYRLAKRPDGYCVFLDSDGLCRIHKDLGEEAKPLLCRMFPFQIVPLEEVALVTLRRFCPAASAETGRSVEEHLDAVRELAARGQKALKRPAPPPVVPGHRRSWHDFLRVAESLEQLVLDERYPLVRRLVHSLQFCELLTQCRLHRVASKELGALLAILREGALTEAGRWFRNRQPLGVAAGMLFRQTALEYVRLHPQAEITASWRERWRLIRLAAAFARGRGPIPAIHPCFPSTSFEALERPLGALPAEVLAPLSRFFEAAAASKQYTVMDRPDWSLVESFRALALAYPVALWLVRLRAGDAEPTADHVIEAVGAIDRAQAYPALAGNRHRRRVRSFVRLRELASAVAWYAR